ncbi:solute carrier family 25 member 36 [Puma concolor]|uniref:Solute carrier family 25 member 36 n=2 Tax=Felinae TaxID=338152 RepID=A0A6P6H1H3_PUMCO|nr:solute carrier family 25 member 36 [Puma concolor]
MSQRDTLVHLFAGGYGPHWACGLGLRVLGRRPWPDTRATRARGAGARLEREPEERRAGLGDYAGQGHASRPIRCPRCGAAERNVAAGLTDVPRPGGTGRRCRGRGQNGRRGRLLPPPVPRVLRGLLTSLTQHLGPRAAVFPAHSAGVGLWGASGTRGEALVLARRLELCGGTVGAILTCPLEVVKTRLQSSSVTLYISEVQLNTMAGASVNRVVSPGPLHCLKVILEKEGPRSLFRGLGPNLVGVAPSRAIYFAAYSNCKEKLNDIFDPDSTQVHMISAAMAGFTAITATNPIWLVKTRLQLDARNRGEKRMGAFECIRKVYQTDGLKGFYRGMSASYAGISETVIHFVIYESIKQKLLEYKIASTMENDEESVKEASDFVGMMLAAATSKTCATTIAYPHEVVRTRLREEGTKYRSFFQTLSLVVQEEGYGSLYRGLTTHLVRQIPNTAIMMATYELVVYLLNG